MSVISPRIKKTNPEGVARFPSTCFNHLVNLDKNQAMRTAAMMPKMMINPLTAGEAMISLIFSKELVINSHGLGISSMIKYLVISIIDGSHQSIKAQ